MISLNTEEKKLVKLLIEKPHLTLTSDQKIVAGHLVGKININMTKYKDGKITKRGPRR